ncbi:HECT-domain-containing protein-like protein [Xylogone sp. PMI_703]|nr:HECT-domain-containing protein-like protein [Xylogone sp. PMI_703]
MTRDTQLLRDDRLPGGDSEVYAALWATAPFPRLPHDAPTELKKLVTDIEDPKRVYTIHHASRRHHFQILVDRYINQVRYGCQAKVCNTPTCFSCRKRLAGGAPVRRYNATSARTLAIYLASQDNPEQGLCHNPSASPHESLASNYLKIPPANASPSSDRLRANGRATPPRRVSTTNDAPDSRVSKESNHPISSIKDGEIKSENGRSSKEDIAVDVDAALSSLSRPTPKDHKSFVQNVFETAPFKVLEWLAPKNLELLTRPRPRVSTHSEKTERPPQPLSALTEARNGEENTAARMVVGKHYPARSSSPPHRTDVVASQNTREQEDSGYGEPRRVATEKSSIEATPRTEPKLGNLMDSKTHTAPTTRHVPNSHSRKSSHQATLDTQTTKGVLNLSNSPKLTDATTDILSLCREPLHTKPKRKLSRQSTASNPEMLGINASIRLTKPLHVINVLDTKQGTPELAELKEPEKPEPVERAQEKTSEVKSPAQAPVAEVPLPQSLPYLSIETINFLCDILQIDETSEKHSLEPRKVEEKLKRSRRSSVLLHRSPRPSPASPYPQSLKQQWRAFIEQSIFDVLSRPDSLLRSFSNEKKVLFDTQTIWYLMLRLTRVAPSLVFDSLWVVAESLFRPPEALETAYDWAKERQHHSSSSNIPLSNSDAAQVINICLHALVAAAPLVDDDQSLANLSRFRSFGRRAVDPYDRSEMKMGAWSLQYQDIMSDELALRLARRVFAAIPTRRHYAELLELQDDIKPDYTPDVDILEAILSTFKFLDLTTPPLLNFSDQERDLYEKKAPTLILDWAKTVMMECWDGKGEIPADGPFGGALAVIAAIYKNRKSLLLGDILFRTEYFGQRLDAMTMPLEWLSFEPSKRTMHLLDHPYLFDPSTLVTYFRAINFSRMSKAYEAARNIISLMNSTISASSLMTDDRDRRKLQDRLKIATSTYLVLHIRRNHVLPDAFNYLWRREERELSRPLKIRLGEDSGEEGSDSGGVQQEFFRLAIAEALNPDYGAFTMDPVTKMSWFQPGSPEPLWKFELIGLIVGLAVYNGLTLPVTFPKALYRKLLGRDITELHHIVDGWPALASGLTSLLEWDEKDGSVEDIFTRTYEFSIDYFGRPVNYEMGPLAQLPQFNDMEVTDPIDAPLVTNENRNSYVSDYIRWLTDISVRPQFEAFKAGFFTCVDRRSVSLFDEDTLQSIVEGVQDIDVSELRRYTRYIGWDDTHRTVRDFWSIVRKYDLEQKRKLLEFVTASDRVPVGGLRNLQFIMQRNGVGDGHLPTSYTCYGTLLLPEYTSKEVLKEKMAMALENSKGFGFA